MFPDQLLRELPNLGEKNKEQPLCRAYSIKARALLHAHLSRMWPALSLSLDADRRYVVSRCPDLLLEMVNCVNQLVALAYARRSQYLHPSISQSLHIVEDIDNPRNRTNYTNILDIRLRNQWESSVSFMFRWNLITVYMPYLL